MNKLIPTLVLSTALSVLSPQANSEEKWKESALDAWIDGKAETTLLLNTNLNSFNINTDVENQIVTLSGSVDSDIEKDLAEELITGIEGVRSVENQLKTVKTGPDLTVSATQLLTDTKITTVVKTRLLLNENINGTDIDVDTKEGVVTLKGQVDSDAVHDLAVSIANNAKGVNEVNDELSISE